MPRKAKYKTLEEKKIANKNNAKLWYQKHKNDPEFILRRKWYQAKYYDKLSVTKQEFLREYNTDYAFYIRSVRTGRLERKIIKSEAQLKKLQNSIHNMKARLADIQNRFGHLDNKNK